MKHYLKNIYLFGGMSECYSEIYQAPPCHWTSPTKMIDDRDVGEVEIIFQKSRSTSNQVTMAMLPIKAKPTDDSGDIYPII